MGLQTCGLNLNRACQELQPHGTADFPCAGYRISYAPDTEDFIPWHWHEEMEIIYLESGSLKLQLPGKTFCLEQGEGMIINSNLLHAAFANPSCELHSLVFAPVLVAGSQTSALAGRYLVPLTGCDAFAGCSFGELEEVGVDAIVDFAAAFEAISSEPFGYEFIVREKLSNLCLALCRRYRLEISRGITELGLDNLRIRRMMDYIHAHFPEKLELRQIARAADVGERECLRCFQRVIQSSPMQYLIKYRVTQGAALLLDLEGSVSEIANRCGFDSPSNFSQMFKRFYGCTPSEYRSRNR